MSRSSGTYTAPSGSWNPAVEGTEVDEGDWNTLLDDIEAALTESTYTAGLGSTDNRLVRTDGTDTKKVQGSAVTLDDTGNLSGIANLSATGYADVTEMSAPSSPSTNVLRLYVADDAGTTRLYAKDSSGTTYTLTTTASSILDAIGSTQGMVLYRGASGWAALSAGTAGHVLTTGGAGANPSWTSAGSGNMVAANNLSDVASAATAATNLGLGTGSSPQFAAVNIGHASDTTISRTGAGDIAVEGNAIYRAGGTDVPISDGGTGASTAVAAFNALSPLTTQGDILYHNGTNNVRLGPGTAGQVLQSGGAGANPSWATVSGTGDVTSASTIADNRLVRGDGGAKGVQQSGITVDDSNNLTGVGTINGFTIGSSGASLEPQNIGLTVSASAGALTIALKGSDGNDPSSSNIVYVPFRSATGTTGTVTTRQVTAATSLTISSGSTMGVTSSTAFRLWCVAFDDAGTVRLGLINCLSQASSVATSILPLMDNGIASSTAEGGAGAADSAQVFYTGTAVTSKPYRILAYLEWNTSGVTAGTWTTTNLSLVQIYHAGIPTPGQPTGRRATTNKTDTFTSSTATTWTDITGFSASLTPTSASNAVRWQFSAYVAVGATNGAGLRMVRGSTAIGIGDADSARTQVGGFLNRSSDANSASVISNQSIDLPQSASSQTYKVQFFLQADTLYFNRSASATDSNVVFRAMSNINLEEVMT